jgi:hypothetical protein
VTFLRTIFAHATPVEGAFAVLAFVATLFSIYALRDATIDSSLLTAAKVDGSRRLVADNNIRQEGLRLVIAGVMLLAGVSFLFLEPPPPEYWYLPQSLVGLIAWILVTAILILASWFDKSVRRKLQRSSPIDVQTSSKTVAAPESNDELVKVAQRTRESLTGLRRGDDPGVNRRSGDLPLPSDQGDQ